MMRRLPLLLAILVLAGCGHLRQPDLSGGQARPAQFEQLSAIQGFEIQGRLRSGLVAGASLHWRQAGEQFAVHLSGPFGAGALRLEGTPGDVTIQQGADQWHTTTPEIWMQGTLGWRLPVADLRWWAVGLPAPQGPAVAHTDAEGRLAQLEQAGWLLRYTAYQQVGTLWLPRRIELDDGATQAVLLFDRWPSLVTP